MPSDVLTHADELTKLLELLAEYTSKLREICEERASARYRRFQAIAMASTVLVTSVAIAYLLLTEFRPESKSFEFALPMLIGVVGMGIALYYVFTTAATSTRYRYSFDAAQVAATVERLIKTASQYREHASQSISEHFEFDLRLAEAEAALKMYDLVFRDSR